ncbi:RelE/StbE replicon stabilization toxin [Pseudoalteromonas luteoviolacea B = ATCC 29581]|nr:RelE/StbE replicon stabilization toxin [Pseudoalteromonas luteoviolacea B = ATCC 29581]
MERLENPLIHSCKLSGANNICKIKLRRSDHRLVDKVEDDGVIVIVLTVTERGRIEACNNAIKRLSDKKRYIARLNDWQLIASPAAVGCDV